MLSILRYSTYRVFFTKIQFTAHLLFDLPACSANLFSQPAKLLNFAKLKCCTYHERLAPCIGTAGVKCHGGTNLLYVSDSVNLYLSLKYIKKSSY